ncbi:ABC transporter ATP-binding protein [Sporosarcina psychrophila]|uniref:ABC transporter ATP-binding protein n=1 Tax=Sporosarcina psychrophila TaxID=1476 RepID=UPI00078DA483|nr:ABC transporter ATP-binding protein [Sporosarcina psychrophila]AMQ07709.1 peptide ABC transporter ATP-binding protein [Sporosarcina psychrophila]
MQEETLLSIQSLKVYFNGKEKGKEIRAVDGIDLTINKKEILCIVGESGSGKSVTALSVMGLIPKPNGYIAEGTINYRGKDLSILSEKEISDIRGNGIAMIFQEPMTSLNPVLTIGDQMSEGLRRHQKNNKKKALQKVIEILEFIGFSRAEQIVKSYPHELSGGMRQRVMIGMALLCEPSLIIADEPTTALDVTIQAQVLDLMRRMKEELSTSVMMITHDLGVVAEMADQVAVMYAGQIVERADADSLFNKPQHPYTKALMKSVPVIGQKNQVLYSIPGTVPSADNFPKGCRFAERCEYAEASCFIEMPLLREIEKSHFVRCTLV